MTGRELLIPLVLSLSIHMSLIPVSSSLFRRNLSVPAPLPVRLVESAQIQEIERPSTIPPKPEELIAPRLLSKPHPLANRAEQEKTEPTKASQEKATIDDLPGTRTATESRGNTNGETTVSGTLFHEDADAMGDLAILGARSGKSTSGRGLSAEGDLTGEGARSGTAGPTTARPLEGYQFKPHYPESARRARAEGTTLLKFQVLATGRVGEILIEKSAGRRDLDEAAAEAVKRWRFEPARMGKEPVAVWVTLPIEFKLYTQ
jgi:TonB family protein